MKFTYLHRSIKQFDTGVKMDLLQEYIFINLDIFRSKLDKNTVQYMIDEMQDEIDAQKRELDARKQENAA